MLKSVLIRKLSTVFVMALLAFHLALLLVSPVRAADWWSTPKQLTFNTAHDQAFSISGDGTKIAFASDLDGDYEIFVVNSDGTGLRQLTFNSALDQAPSINRDGTRIAFMSNLGGDNEIFIINSDGTELTPLTDNSVNDELPSISDDGTKIAFESNLGGDYEIFVVNSDQTGLLPLTDNDVDDIWPSISGDGSKIAFLSQTAGPLQQIWVVNSDKTGLERIADTDSGTLWPLSISKDGSKIAFVNYTGPTETSAEIFVVNYDGTELKRLTTNNVADFAPSISGDGSKVTFTSGSPGNFKIYVVGSDGNGLKQITDNTAQNIIPVISYDGTRIAFTSDVDGDDEVFMVDQDVKAPVTTGDYDNEWHTTDLTITLSATDELSGVNETYYKVNDGSTKKVSTDGQPSITAEGENNKLEYWSTDIAGHEEQPHKTLTGIKLDKNAPTITPSDSVSNGTEIKSSTYTLSWTATDAGSGIDHYEARLDGGEWQDIGTTASHMFSGLGDGGHTLEVKAVDKTGKATTYLLNVVINTSPIGGPGYLEEAILGIAIGAVAVGAVVYKIMKRPKKPPTPKVLRLQADPTELIADRQSKSAITIQLLDQSGKPIAALDDTEVRLNASKGRLETSVVTIPKGKETEKTYLISSVEIGPATVSADAKGLKSLALTLNFVEKKRFCMHCGNLMAFTARTCPKCGNSPPAGVDTRVCKNCKSTIPAVAKFCSECGAGQTD